MWSRLTGAPARGAGAPAHHAGRGKGSVSARVRAAWRVALVSGALTAWAGAGLVALAPGSAGARAGAAVLLLALGAGLAAATAFARAGAAAGTVGAALALAAAGVPSPGALAARVVDGLPAGPVDAALLAVSVIAGGLLAHAAALSIASAGAGPAWPPLSRAWRAESARGLLLARGDAPGALALARVVARGFALAGWVVTDALLTVPRRVALRVSGRAWERVLVDVDVHALRDALDARGLKSTAAPAGFTLLVPPSPGVITVDAKHGKDVPARVSVRVTRVPFPGPAPRPALDLTGPAAAVARVRRVLTDSDVAFLGVFAWSADAQRVEARVNALAEEAWDAHTVEAANALLQDAVALDAALAHRDLLAEEDALLRAFKLSRVRFTLLDRVTAGASGDARDADAPRAAPGPTLVPRAREAVAAGGLAGVRAVTFVPHVLVPVATAWGEAVVLVEAATGACRVDAPTLDVLAHATRHPPRVMNVRARDARFLAAPDARDAAAGAVAAVRRAFRADARYRGRLVVLADAAELLFVPFVVDADGRVVNAVTGALASEALAARVSAGAARPESAPPA